MIAALCNHEVIDLFRHCAIETTAPAARIDRYRLRHWIAHESAAPLGLSAVAITPATARLFETGQRQAPDPGDADQLASEQSLPDTTSALLLVCSGAGKA